eukprot:4629124-Pyramimonas_sp.AAC.1
MSWRAPLAKLRERTHLVKNLGLSFIHSVVAWNRYALPVVGHVAQLFEPPREAKAIVRECHQLLTRAPRHSLPPILLANLKSVHFPVQLRSLDLAARSALTRSALLSEALPVCEASCRRAWESTEVCLQCLDNPFHSDSILSHHVRARDHFLGLPGNPADAPPRALQAKIYHFLLHHQPLPHPTDLLGARLRYWTGVFSHQDVL